MDSVRPSVENWIRFHFGDDWPGRQWLLESPESWMRSGDVMLTFFAEVFENAEQFLGDFAEDDLDEALWRLVWQGYEVRAMINLQAPWPMRERALSSIIPFFRDFLFDRCLPVLGHMSEKPNRPLNSICYMWWDIFPTWANLKFRRGRKRTNTFWTYFGNYCTFRMMPYERAPFMA